MSETVIFLAFTNPKAPAESVDMLACTECRNKTWMAMSTPDGQNRLQCPVCGTVAGKFGWYPPEGV